MLYSLVIPITSLAVGGVNIFVIHPVDSIGTLGSQYKLVIQKLKKIKLQFRLLWPKLLIYKVEKIFGTELKMSTTEWEKMPEWKMENRFSFHFTLCSGLF